METRADENIDPAVLKLFGPPPEGLDLADERTIAYNIAVSIFLGIAAATVLLRLYVRAFMGSRLGYDDGAICVAFFCTCVPLVTTVLGGHYGAGEHIWKMTMPRLITLLKVVYAEPYIYALAVTSTKISILLLYRRLFRPNSGTSRIFTTMFWVATGLTTVYPFVLWITMAAACRPVSYYWNQYLGAKGYCIQVELFFLVLGVINMINDIILLLVPIPQILQLQMNKRMKASIAGIMLLGSFVCFASIARIYYLNGLSKSRDATWWMGPSFAWSSIEPSVAIISACLPTLAPLFRMGRSETSSAYKNVTDTTAFSAMSQTGGRSRNGLFTSNPASRGGGGTQLSRKDDEFELNEKGLTGYATSIRGLHSSNGLDEERGITIKTQVSVTSRDLDGKNSRPVSEAPMLRPQLEKHMARPPSATPSPRPPSERPKSGRNFSRPGAGEQLDPWAPSNTRSWVKPEDEQVVESKVLSAPPASHQRSKRVQAPEIRGPTSPEKSYPRPESGQRLNSWSPVPQVRSYSRPRTEGQPAEGRVPPPQRARSYSRPMNPEEIAEKRNSSRQAKGQLHPGTRERLAESRTPSPRLSTQPPQRTMERLSASRTPSPHMAGQSRPKPQEKLVKSRTPSPQARSNSHPKPEQSTETKTPSQPPVSYSGPEQGHKHKVSFPSHPVSDSRPGSRQKLEPRNEPYGRVGDRFELHKGHVRNSTGQGQVTSLGRQMK